MSYQKSNDTILNQIASDYKLGQYSAIILFIWPILKSRAEICQIFHTYLGNTMTSKVFFEITCNNGIIAPNLYSESFYYIRDRSTTTWKDWKVILLWWGYIFWILLIVCILQIHEIGPFMPKSSVFIFLKFRVLYQMISKSD